MGLPCLAWDLYLSKLQSLPIRQAYPSPIPNCHGQHEGPRLSFNRCLLKHPSASRTRPGEGHFTDGGTRVQRASVKCPRSQQSGGGSLLRRRS